MFEDFSAFSRRAFLRYCAYLASLLAIEQSGIGEIVRAIAEASKKPQVIWLEGQGCGGCSISFLGSENPSPAEFILNMISLRYHEMLMAPSGRDAEKHLKEALSGKSYLLVVEGAVPSDGRFCKVSYKPFGEILKMASENAAGIIAVGACASFGGIPKAGPTGAVSVSEFLKRKDIVNLSTCPVHHDHLTATIVHFLLYGRMPELDAHGRPRMFFQSLIHDNCERRGHFEKKEFLTDWNNPQQKDWCLYLKGCKGPFTYSDCSIRKWNGGISWCVECGAGCQGCSEPLFYEGFSPLFERTHEVFGLSAEEIGKVIGAAASAGIGVYFASRYLSGKQKKISSKKSGEES